MFEREMELEIDRFFQVTKDGQTIQTPTHQRYIPMIFQSVTESVVFTINFNEPTFIDYIAFGVKKNVLSLRLLSPLSSDGSEENV